MTMTNVDNGKLALLARDYFVGNETVNTLAGKYGISPRTLPSRIALARERGIVPQTLNTRLNPPPTRSASSTERPEVLSPNLVSLSVWAEKSPDVPSQRMAYRYAAAGRVPGAVKMQGIYPLTFLVPENAYLLGPKEKRQPPVEVETQRLDDWRRQAGMKRHHLEALVRQGYLPVVEYKMRDGEIRRLLPSGFPVPTSDTIAHAVMQEPALRTITDIVFYGVAVQGLTTQEIADRYDVPRTTVQQLLSRLRKRGLVE